MVSRRAILIGFGVSNLGLILGLIIALASDSVWAGVVASWLIVFALILWLPRKSRRHS